MICEDAIDAVFPPSIERKLSDLCAAAQRCGYSLCRGNRPRLIFDTQPARKQFIKATATLQPNDSLRVWLRDRNPRLSVYDMGKMRKLAPSLNFNEIPKPH